MRRIEVLFAVIGLSMSTGCRHKNVVVIPVASGNSDYVDLAAGGSLSINVPLLKSGGYVTKVEGVQETGTTLTVSIPDLIGFRVLSYAVRGKSDGRVSLKFISTTTTSDGKSVTGTKVPKLPIALPPNDRHIRLIYSVRSSQADHNMVITAAKTAGELNDFTERFRIDPKVCEQSSGVFCEWVPAGIAVRAEKVEFYAPATSASH